ncbi:MAG: DUF4922 domain-containing protein [Ignavibacteriaceae bacterium]
MVQNKLISNKQVDLYLAENNYSDAAKLLLEEQKRTWEQCASGYSALNSVKVKLFNFKGFKINAQFNPKRIISSAANVDEESIKQRKCFLCAENLPEEQKGILLEDFLILCNPYPIAGGHFTISHTKHIPQRIINSFGNFLSLSKSLSKYYTLFYNGPKCGASAPDHLHFQAVNKYFMPLDSEFNHLKEHYGKIITDQESLIINKIDDGIRRFISIESNNKDLLTEHFKTIYILLLLHGANDDEPMMNIHSFYEERTGWRVIIFPRAKHRPHHYFKSVEEQILLSPASADMGGICILPVEKDFNKITMNDLVEVFNEVCIDKEKYGELIENIRKII